MKLNNSPLCISLGDTPILQVLSFFLAHQDFDYSKTELAKNTDLSRQTIYKALEPLLDFEMVVKSRKIANTTLYKINRDSETIKAIQDFNDAIVNIIVEQENDFEIQNQVSPEELKSLLKRDLKNDQS